MAEAKDPLFISALDIYNGNFKSKHPLDEKRQAHYDHKEAVAISRGIEPRVRPEGMPPSPNVWPKQ